MPPLPQPQPAITRLTRHFHYTLPDPPFWLCRKQWRALQSRQMRVLEAKDFLVQQTAEQAALENVPLSDLEKRMMYYAEGKDATSEDAKLNDEFDSKYDASKYEAKMHALLHHAYERLQMVRPEAIPKWDEAISLLAKGDYYLSILWGVYGTKERPQQPPPYDPFDVVKLLGAAILVVAAIFVFNYVWDKIAPHFPYSVGWLGRRLILYSLVVLFFIARHYWRKIRCRKYSSEA